MDTAEQPSQPQSAGDRAYSYVRAGILQRRFTENDLLAEGRIADETGVSRTPVREALLRLEAEGMIRLLPKRGAQVLGVSAREWRDVLSTRLLVESHCATVVIESGRGPVVAAGLQGHLDRLAEAAAVVTIDDLTGYVSADRDFHAALVSAADNAILTRLYAGLRDRQLLMGTTNLLAGDRFGGRRRMEATLNDHRAIAAAIGSEDLPVALALIREHLATASRTLAGP